MPSAPAPTAVAILDAGQRLAQATSGLAEHLGRPLDALLGAPLDAVWPALAQHLAEAHAPRRAAEPGPVVVTAAAPDGSGRLLHVRLSALLAAAPGSGGLCLEVEAARLPETTSAPEKRALEAERRKLAAILDTLHEGVVAFRADGAIALVNPAALELGKIPPPTTIAEGHASLPVLPYDAQGREVPPERQPTGRVLRGESFTDVLQCLRPRVPGAGDERWMAYNGRPVHDEQGRFVLGVLTVQDVTARVLGEQALRRSQHLLSLFVEHAPVSMAMFDRELRFLAVSRRFLADFRLGDVELVGRFHYDVFPDLPEALREVHQRCLAGASEHREDAVWVHQDGTLDWFRWEMHPWYEAPDQVGGLMLACELVTERKRAEDALRESEARFRALFESMSQGVLYTAGDGAILAANTAAQQILGATESAMRGAAGAASPWRLLREDGTTLPDDERPAKVALRTGQAVECVLGLEALGAEPRWLSVHALPQVPPGGSEPAGVYTLFEDITERRQDREALREHAEQLARTNAELTRALQLKDEFLAMMGHELRTPLNAVLGLTEAMSDEVYGPVTAKQAEGLRMMERAGRHLLGVISNILDLVRIGVGAATLDRRPVDVEAVCRAALEMVQMPAQAKEIRLRRCVEVGIDDLLADPRRLEQILGHLLDNAVKFTPRRGTVGLDVASDRAAGLVRFVVSDTGIGMDRLEQERLFEPFTQADARLSREYGGIGLGLSLVERLVDLHGGSVTVASTPGAGSRFVVCLPWTPPADEPPPELSRRWTAPPRVVVADDDDGVREALGALLAGVGCAVTFARDGAGTVAEVRAARPDVVVLDLQMPVTDGLHAIRALRADPTLARLPIIALTTLVTDSHRLACLAAGATRYLARPVSGAALLQAVASVLAAG